MRFAPPGAVLVLGLGSFLLLGAGVLAISLVMPDVVIANFRTAVLVTVVVSGVGGLVSSVLAIDEDEVFFRRAARRFRHGDGADGADGAEPPGVLLLQIDGLGYDTARRAVRDGDLPTMARWLAEGSHAPVRRGRDRTPALRRARPAVRRRRRAGRPVHRRRGPRQPHDERRAVPHQGQRAAQPHRGGVLRLLRQPREPVAHVGFRARRRAARGVGVGPAAARRGATEDQPGRLLPVRAGRHHGDRAGPRRVRDHRRHARRAAGGVRGLPRLRRGHPPHGHRAVRRAGRHPRHRPADRPAAPGDPARAAPLPARRVLRPRRHAGLGVRPPVRRVDRAARRSALRGGAGTPAAAAHPPGRGGSSAR